MRQTQDTDKRKEVGQREGPLLQRSMAWFSARMGKINASELDKVLGFGYGRDEARTKLFMNLRNHTAPEPFGNDATRWGQEHETDALEAYVKHCTFANGLRPREHGGKTHPVYEWLRASPDALLYNEEDQLVGLVEIKCPYRFRTDRLYFANEFTNGSLRRALLRLCAVDAARLHRATHPPQPQPLRLRTTPL